MSEKYYSKNHVWVEKDEKIAKIGITNHAQEQLKDIVFIEFPEINEEISKNEKFVSIESVKTVSEALSPISGKVTEVNEEMDDDPSILNNFAEKKWIIKIEIKNEDDFDELLNEKEYNELIE